VPVEAGNWAWVINIHRGGKYWCPGAGREEHARTLKSEGFSKGTGKKKSACIIIRDVTAPFPDIRDNGGMRSFLIKKRGEGKERTREET